MRRIFPPIGQGNFAVERFRGSRDNINIMFDCGSSSDIDLNDRIDSTFGCYKKIEKVFISHLDDDHVNGLEYLLRNYRVNEVYLPYMTDEERILTRLFYRLKTGHDLSEFTAALLGNPRAMIGEYDTAVTFVRPFNDDESRDRSSDNNARTIVSGEQIYLPFKESPECEWVFIPYNFNQSKRKEQFLNRLKEKGIALGDLSRMIKDSSYWKDEYKQLKAVYEEISGDINTNSMVVYSGTKNAKYPCHFRYLSAGCPRYGEFKYRSYCKGFMEGCLYTGDYDAAGIQKWKQLKKAYRDVWDHIGTVTVPHHGSRHNYQPEMSKMHVFLVINAGRKNPFGHPHDSVLRDIAENGAPFLWITEDESSEIIFEID